MSGKLIYSSATRNKGPILEVLKEVFINDTNRRSSCLEISSGTGQHVSFFAPHFPNIIFQPSEYDTTLLPSIQEYAADCPTQNICSPMKIDISEPISNWGQNTSNKKPYLNGILHKPFTELTNFFDYMININMIHISPIKCTFGLFKNAALLLKPGGFLITYGAYAENGIITPDSNVEFNKSLQQRNKEWGIRDINDLKKYALLEGIEFIKYINMPANNKCIVWKKKESLN